MGKGFSIWRGNVSEPSLACSALPRDLYCEIVGEGGGESWGRRGETWGRGSRRESQASRGGLGGGPRHTRLQRFLAKLDVSVFPCVNL